MGYYLCILYECVAKVDVCCYFRTRISADKFFMVTVEYVRTCESKTYNFPKPYQLTVNSLPFRATANADNCQSYSLVPYTAVISLLCNGPSKLSVFMFLGVQTSASVTIQCLLVWPSPINYFYPSIWCVVYQNNEKTLVSLAAYVR